jgi:F0F1-type ATP synthase assembly protein I
MSNETKHTKEQEAQLEKLSGKTGYCEQCERLGRENKELRHSLNKSERTLEEYKRMYDASEAQNKGLQSLIADQLLIAYIIVGATIGICGFIFLHRG